MLCDRCERFCVSILTGAVFDGEWGPVTPEHSTSSFFRQYVFEDMARVREYAVRGLCSLCSLLYDYYHTFEQDWFAGKLAGQPMWSYPPENRLTIQVFVPTPSDGPTIRVYGFLLFEPRITLEFSFLHILDNYRCNVEAEMTELDITLAPHVERHIGTEVGSYSGSKSVLDLASQWALRCEKNHTQCRARSQKKRLPRRLVNVGELDSVTGWSNPRLVEPGEMTGHYVALSYRWSAVADQFCTTRANLHDLEQFLPLWRLPKTIRDAVGFCRQMGYRYLWVDCLCIIQGDDDDWKEAVNDMASIFENSYLTISALQSEDSNAGLFHHRNYDDLSSAICLRLRNSQVLTLRRPDYKGLLANDTYHSPMNSRGWILQEKLLSPANVLFGKNALHWECRSSTVSEAWSSHEVPTDGILKNILSEIQRPGCFLHPNGHFTVWYMLMMDYSSKNLTFETDRLPAIQGLAHRFGKMFCTTFVAGLWLEDLHRGLLWNVQPDRIYPPGNAPLTAQDDLILNSAVQIAPTWSWINMARSTRVHFEMDLLHGFLKYYHPVKRLPSPTDVSIIDVNVASNPNIARGVVQGTIELWGTLAHVDVTRFVGPASKQYEKHLTHRFSMSRRTPRQTLRKASSPRKQINRGTAKVTTLQWKREPDDLLLPFTADSNTLQNSDYYCLVIADWQFEHNRIFYHKPKADVEQPEWRCYLVLQRVRVSSRLRHPLDEGVFERVGMGAEKIEVVDRFFGAANREKKFLVIR